MALKIITAHFTQSGLPLLGLTPTIDMWEVNPDSQVVSAGALVEIAQGWYRYNFSSYDYSKSYVFTIDGGVALSVCDRFKVGANESYTEDVSFEVWEEDALSHANTGTTGLVLNQIKADTTTIIVNEVVITTLLNTLVKFAKNRTKIDATNFTLTVYDDDCITPLFVWDLKDLNGLPSVAEVCDRIPTTC